VSEQKGTDDTAGMASGLAQALHTAARRYCIDEAARRRRDYFDRSTGRSDTEAHVLPRCFVLDAILAEVERLPPDGFASDDEARDLLALAGDLAENRVTRHSARRSAIAAEAIREERERFVAYVRGISESELAAAEPPPDPDPWWYALVGNMHDEPRTRHYLGVDRMPAAAVLVIQPGKPLDDGVFLLRHAADGSFGGDTWHLDLEEAKGQAEFEYPGVAFEWHEIPRDIADPTSYALERVAQHSSERASSR
jgi:hypothetical protein